MNNMPRGGIYLDAIKVGDTSCQIDHYCGSKDKNKYAFNVHGRSCV
jgi:hypothetical protein